MNEQALQDAFNLFNQEGYNGTFEDYKELIKTNNDAFNDSYGLFKNTGYNGSQDDFSSLMGLETAKTQDSVVADQTVESQNAMGSKLESGLSGSTDDSGFENTQEKNTLIEDYFGKNEFTDFVGDIWRAGSSGWTAGASVDEAFDIYKGKDATDEEVKDFLARTRDIEASGQTDEMIAASKKMAELQKKGYNGLTAFLGGWWDNPTAMLQYTAMSMSQMVSALVDSEEVMGTASATAGVGAATGAGVGAVFGGIGAAPGAIAGSTAGFFAGLSGAMETGMTTAALIQEKAIEDGLDWNNMSDDKRFDYIRKLQNDEEGFNDIKSKALARGVSIGAIDGITGVISGGLGGAARKAVSTGARSALANAARVATTATIETAGGMLSEVAGQAAAGQEFNLEEVLIEGFADKTFTAIEVGKAFKTGAPKYVVNNKQVNGKEFIEAVKIMSDEAIVRTNIKIDNSPAAQKLIDNRRANIAADQNVDSRISDVNDRSEAIKIQKEINSLQNQKGVETKLNQAKDKLKAIQEKYKDAEVDVDIQTRQESVANALETEFEKRFNRNYKGTKGFTDATGLEPTVFDTTEAYKDAVTKAFGKMPEGADGSTGVFAGSGKLFINKEQVRKNVDIATGSFGEISTASHETLHPIFNALIGDASQQGKIVKQFKKQMTSKQSKFVNEQLKLRNYKKSDEAIELMNIFSDGIIRGEINYDQTTFEKIGNVIVDYIRNIVGLNTDELNFKDGRGVYNFLKEYNTSIQKGETSTKAIEAIKTAEEEKGVKVKDAELLTEAQFSKSLSEEESNTVKDQVLKIQEVVKEGKELAAKYGKEFMKSGKQERLEQKVLATVSPVIEKIVTNRTKALYDPIAPDQKRNVSREEYQDSMRSDIQTMLVNEYNGTQDVEKFLVSRAYLRANDLAKRLGIEQTIKTSLDAVDGDGKEVVQVASDYNPETTLKEVRSEENRKKKLVDPRKILGPQRSKDYTAKVGEAISEMVSSDFDELSFAKIKDLAPEVTAEWWRTTVKKVVTAAANLATAEIPHMQRLILKNVDTFIALLPEGSILEGETASERLIGTGVGVPRKLQQVFYDKGERTSKGAGLIPFTLKPNITKGDFLAAFGVNEDGTLNKFGGKDPRAQTILALIRLYGQITTNTSIRELSSLTGEQNADIRAGAAQIQLSRGDSSSITATAPEELISIAGLKSKNVLLKDSTRGKQKFYIDRLENYYEIREDFMKFMPPSIAKFRTLTAAMLGFVYREDGSYYDFYKYDYKKTVNEEGEVVKDKDRLNSLFKRGKADFRNKLLDKKAKPSKYSIITKILLEEASILIKQANLGKLTPNLHYGRIDVSKKQLKPKVKESTARKVLTELKKNNKLNAKIAELYISLLKDFVDNAKNKDQAKSMVVNMLLASNNTVNGWRSLASIESIIYNENKVTDYYFEHNDAMRSVTPDILHQILGNKPISFNVTASLIPVDLAKQKNKKKETKIGDKATTKEFYKKAIAKDKNLKEIQFSKSIDDSKTSKQNTNPLNLAFNKIIEDATGIKSKKIISEAKGKMLARGKGRFKFFIPPSADDFAGLLYKLLGKKEKGNQQQAWFKENLFDPYAKGIRDFESYKENAALIVKNLKKSIKNIPAGLKKINETGFTNEDAVRVYLWAKQGLDIKGLAKEDQTELINVVNKSPKLKDFAQRLDIALGKYPEPQNDWLAGTITTDAINMINTTKRAEFLQEWQANADEIFSKDNLNKLRAAFGDNYVEAMEDMLYRMKSGRNRPSGNNKLTNRFMNWVNDSVGTIMFFNTRSAVLQTLSTVNFINWGDNNPIQAAKAFANQKQFWSDFTTLFNSDFLKQRRSGLKNDINADDIANAAETATNKAAAVKASLLKMGFLPTQMADSFAIALGGASFVRNRINTLKKADSSLSDADAMEAALLAFQEIAEESQQSSRPDRISQQQASPLGRVILAFANTPMQYMRLTKKAFLDLKNGRGDAKTNITKIAYYMAVQNIVFSALQSALFASMFEDDDEELTKKEVQMANSMLDSILRGVGVYGAAASTIKNVVIEIKKQSEKDRPDFTVAAQRALSLSPPVDSKMRKLMSAGRAFSYKTTREKMTGFGLDNPAYYATGQIVSAATNIPLDRAVQKATNIRAAVDNDTKFWQSIALLLGYNEWNLNMVDSTKKDKKTKSKFGKTTKWSGRKWGK